MIWAPAGISVRPAWETLSRVRFPAEVVEITPAILSRASQPFPTPLGTLDAIHLAGARAYRDLREPSLLMATHDEALAAAAVSCGIPVIGGGK